MDRGLEMPNGHVSLYYLLLAPQAAQELALFDSRRHTCIESVGASVCSANWRYWTQSFYGFVFLGLVTKRAS